MKLTKAGEYAIRTVLYLSNKDPKLVVKKAEIAEAMSIPSHFLSKIAQTLARSGILIIRQGAAGGYRLARPANDISLLRVIEAVEGEIMFNDCLVGEGMCHRSNICSVHNVWVTIKNKVRETLAGVTFDQLAAREQDGATGWNRDLNDVFQIKRDSEEIKDR